MEYSGLNYSNGSYSSRPSIHSNLRKTLTTSTGPSYLPSLQRCVYTLEKSTRLLKSSVSMLDEATSGYQRLKTITSNVKKFELVSEHDIHEAQSHVAKEVIPQLYAVADKAVKIIYDLESKEYQLSERVKAEEEKEKQLLLRQKANKSGISNIKRLQSLTRRKDELSKTLSELDEVIGQKRKEFAGIVEKAKVLDSQSRSQTGSVKKSKRNLTIESHDLSLQQEERAQDIARKEKELEAMQAKILDKRRSVNELRSKVESHHSSSMGQTGFTPSIPWSMYSEHYKYLESAMQNEFKVDFRDKSAYEDAFARLSAAYLRELDSRQARTDKELDTLTKEKTKKLSQMRNLCRQLFPEHSIGQTMSKLIEMLVESDQSELYYNSIIQNDFPPEEERRHNLGRAIATLKQSEVVELVLETREPTEGDEESGSKPTEQVVLRIKFNDDGQTIQ